VILCGDGPFFSCPHIFLGSISFPPPTVFFFLYDQLIFPLPKNESRLIRVPPPPPHSPPDAFDRAAMKLRTSPLPSFFYTNDSGGMEWMILSLLRRALRGQGISIEALQIFSFPFLSLILFPPSFFSPPFEVMRRSTGRNGEDMLLMKALTFLSLTRRLIDGRNRCLSIAVSFFFLFKFFLLLFFSPSTTWYDKSRL